MRDYFDEILNNLSFTLEKEIYYADYLDDGILIKFEYGDIVIKYDNAFGFTCYISSFKENKEEEIDSIYERIIDVIIDSNSCE